MKIGIEVTGFRDLMSGIEDGIAEAATAAMRETTPIALAELRDKTTGSGLSQRLANTWRDRIYPDRGRSVTPTGYIWSNAPKIADAFARGATIVPINGSRFLAIPTENVPMARSSASSPGRAKRLPMTPEQVEIAFDQDLFFRRGKQGRVLAFVNVIAAKNGRGFRRATKGRLAQARAVKPIMMFVLVRSATMPTIYDLDGVTRRWTDRYETALGRRLEAL